tara:strand:+ start:4474 stop:5148 length:675 start_codon:yes stop_codon:yes gene_type:complete
MAKYVQDSNAFVFRVKGMDKLVFADAKYQAVVQRAGTRLAAMLRDRIDKQGKDHKGNKLPQVQPRSGWYWTGTHDPRFRGKSGFAFNTPYGGAPLRLVYWRGYRALKREVGKGKTHRGASLTGKMWQNMQVQFKAGRKGTGSVRFEVKFMKGQRVGYHPTKKTKTGRRQSVSVRNRVKAKMLQYNKRDGRGRPVGQAFVLMQPSDAEIGLMLQLISAGIRFANK